VGSVPITTLPSGRATATDHAATRACATVTARANRSLSPRARTWVAVSLCAPVLVIAVAVALHGAWLVLPFAGLEIALIAFAFRWLRAGDDDYESVQVSGDQVIVSRSTRGRQHRQTFNLHWVQVVFEPAGIARKSRLALRSHGRLFGIGALMTEDERAAAAGYLNLQIARSRRAV
jgi:uncharacterized membrane protein